MLIDLGDPDSLPRVGEEYLLYDTHAVDGYVHGHWKAVP